MHKNSLHANMCSLAYHQIWKFINYKRHQVFIKDESILSVQIVSIMVMILNVNYMFPNLVIYSNSFFKPQTGDSFLIPLFYTNIQVIHTSSKSQLQNIFSISTAIFFCPIFQCILCITFRLFPQHTPPFIPHLQQLE